MSSNSVNDVFDDIFQEEISTGKSKETTNKKQETANTQGFFLNENDVNFINSLASKKAKFMTSVINNEALKQTIVNIGNDPSDEEILIADAILAEIDNQIGQFGNQLADDSFKNFLSGKSQQLQLTGYPAS